VDSPEDLVKSGFSAPGIPDSRRSAATPKLRRQPLTLYSLDSGERVP
jgi:hypothetical protein